MLATFLDSDDCFMVYRRFGFLQSRLLLEKQEELRELEGKLDRLDKIEERKNSKHPMTSDVPSEAFAEEECCCMQVWQRTRRQWPRQHASMGWSGGCGM